jgi:hypothetical protein
MKIERATTCSIWSRVLTESVGAEAHWIHDQNGYWGADRDLDRAWWSSEPA